MNHYSSLFPLNPANNTIGPGPTLALISARDQKQDAIHNQTHLSS